MMDPWRAGSVSDRRKRQTSSGVLRSLTLPARQVWSSAVDRAGDIRLSSSHQLPRRDASMIGIRLSFALYGLAVCSLLAFAGCGSKESLEPKAAVTLASTPASPVSLPRSGDPA